MRPPSLPAAETLLTACLTAHLLAAPATSSAGDIAMLSDFAAIELARPAATLTQEGHGNIGRIEQFTERGSTGNYAQTLQAGDRNIVDVNQTGNLNLVRVSQNGGQNYATVRQSGVNNLVDLAQDGDMNMFIGSQYGDNNAIVMSQPGSAMASVTMVGNDNRVELDLQSSQRISIGIYGNNRTVTATSY